MTRVAPKCLAYCMLHLIFTASHGTGTSATILQVRKLSLREVSTLLGSTGCKVSGVRAFPVKG